MKACYIHVPFCRDICAYCDFTRCRYHHGLAEKWLVAIEKEIHGKLQGRHLETIYIGGGTPSALSCEQLDRLLSMLDPYGTSLKEYTLEANVESLDEKKIQILKQHGINRISLGVQTLQPSLLSIIHRSHTKEDVYLRIDQLHHAGIHNISIDLIYGLPTQTMAMWKEDVMDLVKHADIQHISLYALTIEANSQFGRDGVQNIDSDLEADMYEYAMDVLQAHGFAHYEISNFAKPGYASLHNQMYWRYEDFCGIGCGASGKQDHMRYDNTRNLHTYLCEGSSPEVIKLTKRDEMFEMVMMSLRMKQGLDMNHFQECFQISLEEVYRDALQKNIEKHRLCIKDHHVRTTQEGMLFLHDVLIDFLPAEEEVSI